jgi:hypothetical protein
MIKTIVHSTCSLCGEYAEFQDMGDYPTHKYRPFTVVTLCVNDIPELSEQNDKTIQVCQDCYEKLQDLCKKVGVTTQPDDRAISLTFEGDEEVYYIPTTNIVSILSILYHLTPAQTEDSIDETTFVETDIFYHHTNRQKQHE